MKYTSLLTLFVLLSLGCSTSGPGYNVKTNAYLSPNLTNTPSPNEKYLVFSAPEKVENPFLEEEVKFKIEKLLSARGYNLVQSLDEADWVVSFGYGITGGETSTTSVPWQTNQSGNFSVYGSGGYASGSYTQPSTIYIPITRTTYGRFLSVSLIDWIESKKQQKIITTWKGDSHSVGSSSDLRDVLNYLLIQTFQNFCVDTGKEISNDYYSSDPRVKKLQNNSTEK